MLNRDGKYYRKRHNGILKVKRFYTVDLKVLAVEEGSGRLAGKLGAFVADEVAEQFNSVEYLPFERSRYAGGRLNPYLNNTTRDAFGG